MTERRNSFFNEVSASCLQFFAISSEVVRLGYAVEMVALSHEI